MSRSQPAPAPGPSVRATPPDRFARRLFAGLPARYDTLAEVLSFGQNRRWRAEMVGRVAEAALSDPLVLDVATGTAGVALALQRRVGERVVGLDLSPDMLKRGRQNMARRSPPGAPLAQVLASAESMPFPDAAFDALTFTYLLRYVSDPAATLVELARVVRPGGMVAMLEFHVPPNPGWHAMWWLYTRAVLPVAGWALGGGQWWAVGRFLGPSISGHYRSYPDAWAREAWAAAGLGPVGLRPMSLGGGVVMWARRKACTGGAAVSAA